MAAAVPLPLAGQRQALNKETFSDLEPACAVIVRYPCVPPPHDRPNTRKRNKLNCKEKKRKERKQKSLCLLLFHSMAA